MIRRSLLPVAVLLVVGAMAVPVLAGGGGGGSKGNVNVRIKNTGVDPVAVNAVSGTSASLPTLLAGARTLAPNGITQFRVKPGTFTAAAADPNNAEGVNKVRTFQTNKHVVIYLYAAQDTTTATIVGAVSGVKF